MTSSISRADLLAYLVNHRGEELETIADCFGYKQTSRTEVLKTLTVPQVETPKTNNSEEKRHKKQNKQLKAEYFYYLSKIKPSKLAPKVENKKPEELPGFITEKSETSILKKIEKTPPKQRDLITWGKLWPVIRKILSEINYKQKTDIHQLVKIVANGYFPERIPKQQHSNWSTTTILIDYPDRLKLFGSDYHHLQKSLIKMRGEIGLKIQQIKDYPGGKVSIGIGINKQTHNWQMPPAGEPILILSDAGLLDVSMNAYKDWLNFGRKLKAASCIGYLLTPLSPRYITPELQSLFNCIQWDKNSNLQTIRSVKKEKQVFQLLQKDWKKIADILLPCLSPAKLIDPKLLRAVCHLLSQFEQQNFDAGIEALCWNHSDVTNKTTGFSINPDRVEFYRNRLVKIAQKKPKLIQQLYALFIKYHGHKHPSEFYEEINVLNSTGVIEKDKHTENAEKYIKQLIKALYENPAKASSVRHYCYHLLQRQPLMEKQHQQYWSSLWGILRSQLPQQLEQEMPNWINMEMAIPFLSQKRNKTKWYVIQRKKQLCIINQAQIEKLQSNSNIVLSFSTTGSLLLEERKNKKHQKEVLDHQLDQENSLCLPLLQVDRNLHAHGKAYTVSPITRPSWAEKIGQNSQGLFIEYVLAKQTYHSYWKNPEMDQMGYWLGLPPAKIGKDQYGLYADLTIKTITQRFRYIKPGTFLMGSPESEAEREIWKDRKETQHQVTLTQGFWMADTTVTQAFYLAVLGKESKNPSYFTDNQVNPVEQVSWNDTQVFIKKLNQQFPNLQASLPSEAQWEYACRAGINSPFYFGKNIAPEQVNYNGEFPYKNAKKGIYREKTVPVKSLPANDWGLYEMHGNVWEWCLDFFNKDLGTQLVQDPLEDKEGNERVMRGGSWFHNGGHVRSAIRNSNMQDNHSNKTGFRLLLTYTNLLSHNRLTPDRNIPNEDNNKEISLTLSNRDKEPEEILDRNRQFHLIRAPFAYGRTTFINKLEEKYNKKGWIVKKSTGLEIFHQNDIAQDLTNNTCINFNDFIKTIQSNWIDSKGIAILIDLPRTARVDAPELILSNFFDLIRKHFADLGISLDSSNSRLIIATHRLDANKDRFHSHLLSEFTYDVINTSAKNYLKKNHLIPQNVNTDCVTAKLFYATGGYPNSVRQYLENFPDNIENTTTNIESAENNFANSISPLSRILFRESDIMCYRFLDFNIIKRIRPKSLEGKSISNIMGRLLLNDGYHTFEVSRNTLLMSHQIISPILMRRVYAVLYREKHKKQFIDACKKASELYLEYVETSHIDKKFSFLWLKEYWFQLLQGGQVENSLPLDPEDTSNSLFLFLDKLGNEYPQFYPILVQQLQEDWEFQFMINFDSSESVNCYNPSKFTEFMEFLEGQYQDYHQRQGA